MTEWKIYLAISHFSKIKYERKDIKKEVIAKIGKK